MLTALWEDEEILVIDKPSGLATQLGAGIKLSLVEAVERDFGFRPYLVHRLDRETSGCIIVARDSRAASKWTELIAGRAVGKTYRAIVAGLPTSHRGTFDQAVRVRGEEKSATTRWRLAGGFGELTDAKGDGEADEAGRNAGDKPRRYSLLELELGTGRTHQIRLQLSGAGMPILGDEAHGDFRLNKELRKSLGLKRLLLHSWRLELPGRKPIEAPEPPHFAAFLALFADAPSWASR